MIKRFLAMALASLLLIATLAPNVCAQEQDEERKHEKLTHLEVLEQLCTGFPYAGYEKYPDVPQYFQQDYPDVPYGGWNGRVSTHGCGITSMAMLATYMMDTELTPEDLAIRFAHYANSGGTAFALFDETPVQIGFGFEKRSYKMGEVLEALQAGKKVISLQMADHFTTTAHFIVLTGLTEDGKILVKDSNIFNHTGRFAGQDVYENGFEPEYVHTYNHIYWIYPLKVVRVPGCDRCADPNVETVPLFIKEHYCEKCSKLLEKREAFHHALNQLNQNPNL